MIRRILIAQTAFLGDVILVTALIRATKELYPTASVDVLVIPQTAAVLVNNPYLRRVVTFDKRAGKSKAFTKTLLELRRGKYDLAIAPHSSMTTALLLYLAGIPRRIGFDRLLSRYLLTDRVPFAQGIHRGEKNLQLLRPLSDRVFPLDTRLFPAEDDLRYADDLAWPFPGQQKVAIAPASVWFTKQWPAEYYATLVRELVAMEVNVAVIGAPSERDYCRGILEKAGPGALDLSGLKPLRSAAVIGACDLLVCNDSGALHIGDAMRTPVFAFFGPTVRRIGFYPYRERDRILEIELDCRPCRVHGSTSCPRGHHHCMTRLTPDMALRSILGFLGKEL
jgi:heptosyltransferase II